MSEVRVAIVAGVRTAFQKQRTGFGQRRALELGAAAVRALVTRTGVPVREIERVVFGQVVPSLDALNVAREVTLEAGLPPTIDAYSVARACATGYQALADVANAIAAGDIACAIAGGTDSASDVPIALSKNLGHAFIEQRGARTLLARVKPFTRLGLGDFVPEPPALTERTTGLTMGEHAERMAQENGITRAAQDAYAHRSQSLAAAAWADGRFAEEVVAVDGVATDNLVRKKSDPAHYARLHPVFDRETGTITAGNSSALTDGASALLVMREDRAKALGLAPLAYVKAAAFTALDPHGQLLMGPAYAIPRALARAGATLSDCGLLDLHEAFAAQVLSVTQALESKAWAAKHLGRGSATGAVDWDRFNVMGGSIALGHPFAATGGRQLAQAARELRRRGGGLACVAACAAGGLGAAVVLEVDAA